MDMRLRLVKIERAASGRRKTVGPVRQEVHDAIIHGEPLPELLPGEAATVATLQAMMASIDTGGHVNDC